MTADAGSHETDAAAVSPVVLVPIDCPLCGHGGCDSVLHSPDWGFGVPGEFHLVRCRQCRHVYLNPAPDDASLPACYPPGYAPHLRPVRATTTGAPAEATTVVTRRPWYLSPLVKAVPGPAALYRWVTENKSVWIPEGNGEGRRALEIGCASGWFLAQLQDRGWNVTGIDLVDEPLQAARSAGFTVHHGTLEQQTFAEGSFDATFAWMVLEHVPRPVETLQQIHRLLKPGGWWAFSVPNLATWERVVFGSHWKGYDLPRHLQHFTPRRLRRLLSDEGFEVQAIIHQPSFLNWIGSLGSWRVARHPEGRLGPYLTEQFFNTPPLPWYFALGPLARLNAFVRQSGRLTIVTTRR